MSRRKRERDLTGRERFVGNDELVRQNVRTFELVNYITARPDAPTLPCNIDIGDMPTNMQEAVLAAMERKSYETGLKLALVHCEIDEDHEYVEGVTPSKWFIHIVLSEVVVGQDITIIHGGGA